MRTLTVLLCCMSALWCLAQSPHPMQWEVCHGGNLADIQNDLIQLEDGGLVAVSSSISTNLPGGHSGEEIWLIKLDTAGTLLWQECVGGSLEDEGWALAATPDGGFFLAAYSRSVDGDLAGCGPNTTLRLLKLDASGAIQWHTCGPTGYQPFAMCLAADGGCLTAGRTAGAGDLSLVKFDAAGTQQWAHTYGGSDNDLAYDVLRTDDGGYMAVGQTMSNDGDVSGHHGGLDMWVVKVDSLGTLQWQRCLGGTGSDIARSMARSATGDVLVLGGTNSSDGDVTGLLNGASAWAVMLDPNGGVLWQQCYGPDTVASGQRVIAMDNGFVCVATTTPSATPLWFFGIGPGGAPQWDDFLSVGTTCRGLCATTDGGFAWASNEGSTGNLCPGFTTDVVVAKVGRAFDPTATGVGGHSSEELQLNLYDGWINLTAPPGPQWKEVVISDAKGRTVLVERWSGAQRSLDVRHLATGAYVLTLYANEGSARAGFVVMRP